MTNPASPPFSASFYSAPCEAKARELQDKGFPKAACYTYIKEERYSEKASTKAETDEYKMEQDCDETARRQWWAQSSGKLAAGIFVQPKENAE